MTSANTEDLAALLSSTVLIILGVFLTAIAGLLERIIIARWFDPTVYGEVAIGLAILSMGATVSMIGFNQGIPRFISRFDDDRQKRGVWLTGLLLSMTVSGVVSAVLILHIDLLEAYLFDGAVSTELIQLLILTIPVNVGLTVGVSTLRGMENTRYKIYTKNLVHPGLRLVLIAGLLVAGVGVVAVGYAYLAAGLVALIVAHALSNRLLRLVGPVRTKIYELMAFSAPLIITMVFAMLLTRTDTLLLGYFQSSGEVGLYNAAYPLANSLLMFVSAFGYLYLPLASRLDADGKRNEVASIYRITTKWGYIVTFPAFLAFIAFPEDILKIFFSGEYAGAELALVVLSVGFFTSAAAGRNRSTLAAFGYTTHIMVTDVVTLALNLLLNIILIPRYGIEGAAVASAAAFILRNIIFNIILVKNFGITPFSRQTVAVYVTLLVGLVPITLVLSGWVVLSVVTLLGFLIFAGIVGIFLTVLVGGVESEDGIIIEFFEDAIGVEMPFVHDHIPNEE